MSQFLRKIDANQRDIVKALQLAGASVCDLSGAGRGVPDLLVGYQGRNLLMEVKRPWEKGIAKSDLNLTPPQQEFFAEWLGQVATVTTPEEALALLHAQPEPASQP